MSKLTQEQAEVRYENQVAYAVNSLHHLANEVGRLARTRYHGDGTPRSHVMRATDAQRAVLLWLYGRGGNGPMESLVMAAIEVDHPTARSTPAELLDQAATALEGLVSDVRDGPDSEVLADAALRGAGII